MDVQVLNGRMPRCLTRFSLGEAPSDLDGALTEGFERILHETLRVVPYCNCGNRTSRMLGVREKNGLWDPFALECINCKRVTTLFNSSVDGYNAELDALEGAGTTQSPEPGDVYECKVCGKNEVTPGVLVTYQGDEADLRSTSAPMENLFDVIAIAAKCASCGAASRVTEVVECA